MMEQKIDSAQELDERDMRVVTCAAELFLQRGLEDVTMVDIAKAAHVGVATVYRHFSTKSRIAVEAATLLWERFNERILKLVESDHYNVPYKEYQSIVEREIAVTSYVYEMRPC